MQRAPATLRRARRPPRWVRLSQLSTSAVCLPEPETAAEAPAPSSNQHAWPRAADVGTRQLIMQCAPAAPRRAHRRPRWARRSQLSSTASCLPATTACLPEPETAVEAQGLRIPQLASRAVRRWFRNSTTDYAMCSGRARRRPRWVLRSQQSPTATCLPEPETAAKAPAPLSS